jgi:hypothetical protein
MSNRTYSLTATALLSAGVLLGLTGCGGEAASQPSASSTSDAASGTASETPGPTEVDGTYAVTWTVEELTEALGGEDNPEAAGLAEGNAGTIRLELDSGRYDMVFEDIGGDSCPGTYVLDGDRIVMTATTDPTEWDCGADSLGSKQADAAWSVDEESLTLTEWKLPDSGGPMYFNEVFLGTKPLERVGG